MSEDTGKPDEKEKNARSLAGLWKAHEDQASVYEEVRELREAKG